MPLIRAFGRWLRRQSTDQASGDGRSGDLDAAPVASMARSWAVIFVAVLGVVPITLVGGIYEVVRRIDRGNLVPRRGHWVAAIVISVAIGLAVVSILTRSA